MANSLSSSNPNRIPRVLARGALAVVVLWAVVSAPLACLALTLEEALRYAVEKSETARIAEQSAEETRADARRSIAFLKPQTRVGAGFFRLGSTAEDSPGFQRAERDVIGTGEVSQLLFAGGRIWRSLELKDSLEDQADIQYQTGIRDLRLDVKLAFIAVLFQDASIHILKDRLQQRTGELEDARDLREAGMVTSLDVRQATLTLNNAVDQLRGGEAAHHEALVDFNVVIGRSGAEELLTPSGRLDQSEKVAAGLGRLQEAFGAGSLLNIRAAERQYETARLNHQIVKGEAWPELQAVASGESHDVDRGEGEDSWNVGLQLRWDILDGGLVKAKKDAARARVIQAENQTKRVKKELAGAIDTLEVNAASLAERITLQRETVTLSAENYEDARGRYRAGTITQTRLGEFNLAYAEARFGLLRLYYLENQLLIQIEALLE